MLERLANTKLEAIATCVPSRVVTNDQLASTFGEEAMRRFGKSTGIMQRRVSTGQSSLDLSVAAAECIIADGVPRDSIDAVIFVSQTPEYLLPASAAIAQHRLGLRCDIAAFDLSLGCSGYVYGLLVAGKLLAGKTASRILVLVGDTITRICSDDDRATRPIFGDAGSATLLSTEEGQPDWFFQTGTDGSGAGAIIVHGSGFASPDAIPTEETIDAGRLFMNGSSVFNFATTRVPEAINAGLAELGWEGTTLDTVVLHQANTLILNTIARKIGVAKEDCLNVLDRFGNTSCASIPLAMTQYPDRKFGRSVLSGFGVGLSWATMFSDLPKFRSYHTEI